MSEEKIVMPLEDLYGDVVGEIVISRDGTFTGRIDPDSYWHSITVVGRLGLVDSFTLKPVVRPAVPKDNRKE